jgi:SRSO17 transposase
MEAELRGIFERYRSNFKTKTYDSSKHGWTVLKGYLLLETDRTYVNIDKKVNGVDADGQNIQQFMSDTPWTWQGVFNQVCQDINADPKLKEGTLNFDESGDECSGTHKAGSSRQYLGRLGKVELGQVGVLSSYSKDGVWLLTDAELYLPKNWFEDEVLRKRWERLHIPDQREFKTKIELARELFDNAIAQGLSFKWTGADGFYGKDIHFRRYIDGQGKHYMMSIPNDEMVWMEDPLAPDSKVLGRVVRDLAKEVSFEPIKVRDGERGELVYEHAFIPVWSMNTSGTVKEREARQELLVLRKEPDNSFSYAFTNVTLEQFSKVEIAVQRAERYFVERTIQDCKSELGWDELQALKYPAYMHSLAICAIALMFLAKVKLNQRPHYETPEAVKKETSLERLPDLSLANVKELMRSVMPMPQLTKEQARQKIIQTLFDRTRSTASRLRKQKSG